MWIPKVKADSSTVQKTPSSSAYTDCYHLDQPALLQILCINADGGFRKLSTLLEQPLDVLADEVGFKIHGVVHLLEQRSVVSSMVLSESKVTLPARLDDRR